MNEDSTRLVVNSKKNNSSGGETVWSRHIEIPSRCRNTDVS